MRRILLAISLLPFASYAADGAANADIAPGAFELSGDAALDLSAGSTKTRFEGAPTDDTTDTRDVTVRAAGLYYVAPNAGLGVAASYTKSTDRSDGLEESSSLLVVGPAVSLQHPVANELAVFARGSLGYAVGKTIEPGRPDVDATGYAVVLQAGLKYFVVKQFSLDAGATYQFAKLRTDEIGTGTGTLPELETKASQLGVAVGLSVYFGR